MRDSVTGIDSAALDRWITGNYGDDQYPDPPRLRGGLSAEDFLGEKVVVGENDWGLGRWGTIVSWETWEDADEDGRYGGVDFEVEFPDGESPRYGSISEAEASDQLFPEERS